MKKMTGTELKVVLLVTRKTLGWFDPKTTQRKTQDYISQSQFVDFTGQTGRAVATSIQSCVEHGWIIARDRKGGLCDTPEKRARRKVWYQLGSIFTGKLSGEESSPDSSGEENDTHLVKKVHQSGEESSHNKRNYTKETLTKEDYAISENRGGVKEPLRAVPDPNVWTRAQVLAYEAENNPPAFDPKLCFRLFADPFPRNWLNNRTQRAAAKNLTAERGLEKVALAFGFWKHHKDEEYCPDCSTPWDMDSKWTKLQIFRDKRL